MHLVLITSVVCTPNTPLSYINTRSCFTHNERFEQTQKTISSIKEKIPNAKIFIVECSDLSKEQTDYFINVSDYFINTFHNENVRTNVCSISKSLGEGTMTHYAIEFILENNIQFDKLIKLSGRYWLSSNFHYATFDSYDIVVKCIDDDINNVFTCLYQLPVEYVIKYKVFLENNILKMMDCVGYEVLFSQFIKLQPTHFVKCLTAIGVEGHVSVSNDLYRG